MNPVMVEQGIPGLQYSDTWQAGPSEGQGGDRMDLIVC